MFSIKCRQSADNIMNNFFLLRDNVSDDIWKRREISHCSGRRGAHSIYLNTIGQHNKLYIYNIMCVKKTFVESAESQIVYVKKSQQHLIYIYAQAKRLFN